MSTKTLSFAELAALLQLESQRGIINGGALMAMVKDNRLPKIIKDIRGAVRLSMERAEEGIEVTQYSTELSRELVGEIY